LIFFDRAVDRVVDRVDPPTGPLKSKIAACEIEPGFLREWRLNRRVYHLY
jgi:hypothetical protein